MDTRINKFLARARNAETRLAALATEAWTTFGGTYSADYRELVKAARAAGMVAFAAALVAMAQSQRKSTNTAKTENTANDTTAEIPAPIQAAIKALVDACDGDYKKATAYLAAAKKAAKKAA